LYITHTVNNRSDSNYYYPENYSSSYNWYDNNISFSATLPVAQRYVLTLNNPAIALGGSDKLLFDGALTDTPYNLNLTDRGTWDVSITSGNTDQVIFGSSSYYANQDPLKELLQVGTTITISDNNWGQSGVYLVTSVGTDTVWNSVYGFSVQFQYVSGTNYTQQYISLAGVFASYIGSISGTVVPNYTTEYKSSNFSTLNNTSYVSFSNYDFINVGDEVSYIPGIASIQFKDDAGNNVKAISYNNSTGTITYDGIVQSLEYNSTLSSLWTINADSSRKADNIAGNSQNVIAIGNNAKSRGYGIAIGNNTDLGSEYGLAIGNNPYCGYNSVTIGNNAYSTSDAVALGPNTNAAYGSVAIGYGANANGSAYSTALGFYSHATARSQVSLASSGSSSYKNQSVIVQWSNPQLSNNSINYIETGLGTSVSTNPASNSNFWFYLNALGSTSSRTVAIAEATILYKPTSDTNNDDVKVQVVKFLVRTTSSNTWVINQLSTTDVYTGSGTLNSNWSTSFEIYNNTRLVCKVDKGTDSTPIGVCAKVEFKVLTTA
jgi:hypothetical protein